LSRHAHTSETRVRGSWHSDRIQGFIRYAAGRLIGKSSSLMASYTVSKLEHVDVRQLKDAKSQSVEGASEVQAQSTPKRKVRPRRLLVDHEHFRIATLFLALLLACVVHRM
jgi:hypothetical protein